MKLPSVKLLLELDALLDTRLSILGSMDPKRTAVIMQDTSYTTRVIDRFQGFDNKAFKEAYDSRTTKALAGAMRTDVFKILHDFITRVMNRNIVSPTPVDTEIVLNTYPYKLTEKEQTIMTLGLIKSLPLCPKVTFVDIPIKKLTPQYLRGFGCVIMYNFNEWLTEFLLWKQEKEAGH